MSPTKHNRYRANFRSEQFNNIEVMTYDRFGKDDRTTNQAEGVYSSTS